MRLLFFILFSFSAFGDGTSLLNKSVEVEGFGSIRYRGPTLDGERPPIVLLHGIYGGASHRTWRKLLPLLDRAGERVYILDLPGVGESDKPKRAYNLSDIDAFVETFLRDVVQERASVVSESILSNAALRVAAKRPDLVRRVILTNPSGVYSLIDPPSDREQKLYDKLFQDDDAATAFYQNLLRENSLRYFLQFSFNDDSLIDDSLLKDFSVMRPNIDQRFLTLSFVGGQLYRSFKESSEGVFVPVLALFGAEYEAFGDNKIARAKDFAAIRPFYEYVEITGSGSSVQRERPERVAQEIINFTLLD